MNAKDEQPWRQLGLTEGEYERIRKDLGREPNLVELNIYSVMWSEHCSYKHSRAALRMLPVEGPHVLQGPGRTPEWLTLGAAWGRHSRSRATITPRRWSLSRARLRAPAGLSATSWPWGRARQPCSARCASGRWRTVAAAIFLRGRLPE